MVARLFTWIDQNCRVAKDVEATVASREAFYAPPSDPAFPKARTLGMRF
jgi:hypothetical protein